MTKMSKPIENLATSVRCYFGLFTQVIFRNHHLPIKTSDLVKVKLILVINHAYF